MNGLFVDTAGWMACADGRDPVHKKACDARDRWLGKGGILITSDYIMDESLTLIRQRLGLQAAEIWWQMLEGSSFLQWELVGPERAEKARHLFFRFKDKDFSFTDCTSFIIMQELKLRNVLSSDKHFHQMGFCLH